MHFVSWPTGVVVEMTCQFHHVARLQKNAEPEGVMKLIEFHIGRANAKIKMLEGELGRPESGPYFKIKAANEKLAELQAEVACRKTSSGGPVVHVETSKPKAAPVVSSAGLPASCLTPYLDAWRRQNATSTASAPQPPAQPMRKLTREKLFKIAAVFPALTINDDWSDDLLFKQIERAAYQGHLRLPGMRPDAELAEVYWRTDAANMVGTARLIRAMRRDRIAEILKG